MRIFDEKKIKEIAEKYGLNLLLLFGSQASGKANKLSDYDFGFVSREDLDYLQRSELMHDLSMLAEFPNVEEVDLKKAGPFLLKEITKNNSVLFERDFAYNVFFSYAVRTYLESEKLFKLHRIIYNNTINKYRQIIYDQRRTY